MEKKVLLAVFLVVAAGYGQRSAPEWTASRPIEEDYYIGIGHVRTARTQASEYKSVANSLAFDEISNQIFVQISSSTESIMYEDEENSVDRSSFELQSSTIADLEGLTLVDNYQSSSEYWVYWRLSKVEHGKNIEKYEILARDYFTQSKSVIPGVGVVNELSYLVKAYESILRAHGKIILIKLENEKQILNSLIPTRIEAVFANIETKGINTLQTGKEGRPLDAPLILQVKYNSTHPMNGIPIRFSVVKGKARIEEQKMADQNGECRSLVTEILSNYPDQVIQGTIDLKAFKLKTVKNAVLDDYLDQISGKRAVNYYITVAKLYGDNIAVKVLPQEGISAGEANYINEEFVSQIKRLTNFEVLERTLMEEVLKESDFNINECSSDECQVQIGKLLAVRKMIYVLLWKFEGTNEYRGQIKMINIETGKNEHVNSVKFRGDVTGLADYGISEWVTDFYSGMNQGEITLVTPIYNVSVYNGQEFWGMLPIFDKTLADGTYRVIFTSPGHESLSRAYRISVGQDIKDNIELKKKSRFKAFRKSLFFPGSGQRYSADEDNRGRTVWGWFYTGFYLAGVTGSIYTWDDYFRRQNEYNQAHELYRAQINLTEIEKWRTVTQDKHGIMVQKETIAIIISSVTGGIWVWNILDAIFAFPTDINTFSTTQGKLYIDLKNVEGHVSPTVGFRINL